MIWLESWVAETPVAVCPVTDTWYSPSLPLDLRGGVVKDDLGHVR